MHRKVTFAIVWVLVLAACSRGSLSLSEYSSEIATLVESLDSRLDAQAEKYFSGPPSVDGAREYLRVRVDGYRDVVAGIDSIDPPEQVIELHETFREIMGNLLVAEEVRAEFADTVTSTIELGSVWEGREAQAIRAVQEEAIVLCYAAQAYFDETERREILTDVPWMPSELKEVVRVALDCP